MSKSPEERAAEALPCQKLPACGGHWHDRACRAADRPAVAEAIREAEREAYERAINFYCLGKNPHDQQEPNDEQQAADG